MAVIELTTDRVSLAADPHKTILENTLAAGIPHTHACGGQGLCSTCRVYVQEGNENLTPRNEKELKLTQQLGLLPEVRLACQTQLRGDVKLKRLVLDEIDEKIILDIERENKPRSLGVEKDASILFVDIADYTSFTDSTTPYDVVHILNRYFHIAGTVVKKYGGRIIDYYGDGFLAIFGLDDNPLHAENLIKAGFELEAEIEKFDHLVHEILDKDFKIRLGAHTGKIIWGTIGIEGMQKEAAIGDTVNLASRIEQANKVLNTRFLISEALYHQLQNRCSVCRSFEIEAKGKAGPLTVYSLDDHFLD